MGVLLIISLFAALVRGKPVFWGGVAAGAAGLVVLSGSRGAMVAVTCATAALLLVAGASLRTGTALYRTLVLALFALLVSIPTGLAIRVHEVLQARVVELTLEQRHTAGRDGLVSLAGELWLGAPLHGIGLGGFADHSPLLYPHNLFLEVLLEGGLIAFLMLCLCTGIMIVTLYRRWREIDSRLVSLLILFFVGAQFSGDLFDSRWVFVLGAACIGTPGAPVSKLDGFRVRRTVGLGET
jgi:O-antigen ligase